MSNNKLRFKSLKRAASLMLSLLLILNLSGCWSYHELNSYSFVVAMGVDKADDGKFLLTEQVAIPSSMKGGSSSKGGGSSGQDAFWNVENRGETVFATVRDNTRKVQRRPFFSHNKLIIFGMAVAKEDVFKYIDFIARDSEPRLTTWICVANEKASDLLKQQPHLEKTPADKIEKVLEGNKFTSEYHNIQVREFLDNMLSESKAAVVPIIELETQGEEEKGGKKEDSKGDQSSGGKDSGSKGGGGSDSKATQEGGTNDKSVIVVNNSAVFKDFKMVGQMDNIQTRGYSFVTDNAKGGIITINSPKGDDRIDIEFHTAKSSFKMAVKGDEVTANVKIKMTAGIADQETAANYATSEEMEKLEKIINNAVKDEVMASVKKAKELDADIFLFGDRIYKQSPKTWNKLKDNWDETFKNIKVEVSVETALLGAATIKNMAKP